MWCPQDSSLCPAASSRLAQDRARSGTGSLVRDRFLDRKHSPSDDAVPSHREAAGPSRPTGADMGKGSDRRLASCRRRQAPRCNPPNFHGHPGSLLLRRLGRLWRAGAERVRQRTPLDADAPRLLPVFRSDRRCHLAELRNISADSKPVVAGGPGLVRRNRYRPVGDVSGSDRGVRQAGRCRSRPGSIRRTAGGANRCRR